MLGADLVREARRRAGLTQRELAERAKTTQSAIARLESGRTSPSFDQVLRLVRLCRLDLRVVLDSYDDSDIAQAEALQTLAPDERIARMEAGIAFSEELRDAHQQAMGA
ncbi:hypothetical protein BH23ACT9_BH23ACT9_07880 [soil metagenome]